MIVAIIVTVLAPGAGAFGLGVLDGLRRRGVPDPDEQTDIIADLPEEPTR